MTSVEFKVELQITASHQFFDGAGILAGLCSLEREGKIRLKIGGCDVFDPKHKGIILFEAERVADGQKRRMLVDLADRGDYFAPPFLNLVDVYYKRSFSREFIRTKLPQPSRARFEPYGLNIACLGPVGSSAHVRGAFKLLTQRLRGIGGRSLRFSLEEFVANCRMIPGMPPAEEFEGTVEARAVEKIILQTRLWPPEPSADSLSGVNEERILLTRALKTAFGDRFIGGIMADSFAQTLCPPDLLVHQNMKRPAYIRMVKGAAIGIYTRGLHHAIAIKMAEYLAAGLCIVSEPIKFELPVPLVEGVNYLVFRNHDECVERCKWLLANPAEAAKMRAANLAYWRKWTQPKALVHDLLTRAFEPAQRDREAELKVPA